MSGLCCEHFLSVHLDGSFVVFPLPWDKKDLVHRPPLGTRNSFAVGPALGAAGCGAAGPSPWDASGVCECAPGTDTTLGAGLLF